MRNWRCEDDYAFTEKLTWDEWAWEFLRRNADYRTEWNARLPGYLEAIRARDWSRLTLILGADLLGDPWWGPLLPKFGERGISHPYFCIPVKGCRERWGIGALYDPDSDYSDFLEGFGPAEGPHRGGGMLSRDEVWKGGSDMVAFVVDLRIPIKPQVEEIQFLAKLMREPFRDIINYDVQRLRKQPQIWRRYLRILDAQAANASVKERALRLFPVKSITEEGDPDQAEECLQQAQEWTQPDRYLRILGFYTRKI